MDGALKVYTADELRTLAYKNDIETFHSYILDYAKYGYTEMDIEIDPHRHMLVIKKLRELFVDVIFTYLNVVTVKENLGYMRYRVSWKKLRHSGDVVPIKGVQYMRYSA
jgi:hypothetical protein